jgi:hypothetical protein
MYFRNFYMNYIKTAGNIYSVWLPILDYLSCGKWNFTRNCFQLYLLFHKISCYMTSMHLLRFKILMFNHAVWPCFATQIKTGLTLFCSVFQLVHLFCQGWGYISRGQHNGAVSFPLWRYVAKFGNSTYCSSICSYIVLELFLYLYIDHVVFVKKRRKGKRTTEVRTNLKKAPN